MNTQTITPELDILHDYQLEDWLRKTYSQTSLSSTKQPTWQQRVMYAAGHAINRYYSLAPELREVRSIRDLVNFRWPKRPDGFENEQHYWETKDKLTIHLSTLLSANQPSAYPVMLYEQQKVKVPELGAELSLIFQTVWQTSWATAQPDDEPSGHKSLIVQKFFWEQEPELEEAFIHLATVFCQTAFGSMPERIDIFTLSEGKMYRHIPRQEYYAESIDYLQLLRHAVPGGNRICAHCRSNAGVAYQAPAWSLM